MTINKKKTVVSLLLISLAVPVSFSLINKKESILLTKGEEPSYTITLDSSTSLNPACTRATSRKTSFSIVDGSSKSGYFVCLTKRTNGNNTGNEAYIQNTTPITGISSIDITYYGTYLTLFGADESAPNASAGSYTPEAGEFYKVKTFGDNTVGVHSFSTTDLNSFLYVKIAANRQYANLETYITSIEFNYSCFGDHTSERSDLSNNASNVELNYMEKSTIHPSDNSVEIIDDSFHYVSFKKTYLAEELNRYALSFDIKTTSINATHIPFWLQFGDHVSGGNNGPWTITSFAIDTWQTFYLGLDEVLQDESLAADINYVYFKWNGWGNSVPLYLDNVHVVEKNNYPSVVDEEGIVPMDDSLDESDLSNLTVMASWGNAKDCGFVHDYYVTETRESRKISQTSSYQPFNFSLQEYDMKGCELSFNVLLEGDLQSNNFSLSLVFDYNGTLYRKNVLTNSVGVTCSTLNNALDGHSGWFSVHIDFDEAVEGLSPYEASYVGFSAGRYETLYFDNMILTGFDKPDYSGSTFKDANQILSEITTGWNLGNDLDNIYGYNNYLDWVNDGANKANIFDAEKRSSNLPATQRIIDKIVSLGFDAIRIPITWYQHMDENDIIDARFLYRVKEIIDYCMKHNLITIINLHHDDGVNGWLHAMDDDYNSYNGLTKSDMNRKFKTLWLQVATYFKDYDYHLIFEGHNETLNIENNWTNPTNNELDHINELNQLFVDTVRKTKGNNSYRTLICSTYAAGASETPLNGFEMPTDTISNRLIAEIHSYEPHSYTDSQETDIEYTHEMQSKVYDMWDRVYSKFVAHNIPVIMGEYGTKLTLDPNDTSRVNWLNDFVSIGNSYGVKMFHWDSGGEYRIIKRNGNAFNVEEYNTYYNQVLLSHFE